MMIGNMGEINTLTDRLAMMPDTVLPRLAQQYKNDAITLSLILSEKNRRDRVRQSIQAQAGAAPMPKVNDQIVASMTPQQTPGIAGLPAPTMQGMADGGIAGYADGGEVEGYADGGKIPRYAGVPEFGSVVRSGVTNPNAAFIEFLRGMGIGTQDFIQSSPQAQASLREMFRSAAGAATPAVVEAAPTAAATATQAAPAAAQAAPQAGKMAAMRKGLGSLFSPAAGRVLGWGSVAMHSEDLNKGENEWMRKRAQMEKIYPPQAGEPPAALAKAATDPNVSPMQFEKMLKAYVTQGVGEKQADATTKEAPATGGKAAAGKKAGDAAATAGTGAGARAGTAGSSAPIQNPFAFETLQQEQEAAMRPLDLQRGELRNQLTGMRAELEGQAADRLRARKEEIEAEGDIYAGRTERIKARETDLLKQKDTNTGLALLEAGLAIMSTPGSLGTAIGKGAREGTARYAQGLASLRAAQERLEEAKDKTEELRLNRSDMNKREIRELQRDADNARLKGAEMFYNYTSKMYDLDRGDTNKLMERSFEGKKFQAEQAGRERVAQIMTGPQWARLNQATQQDAKTRAEFLKVQQLVDQSLSKNPDYQLANEATKQLMKDKALRDELARNPWLAPYAANVGFAGAPTGGRVVAEVSDEESSP